jgi:enoyl-CoA hydratase/carnithine racemase
MPFSTIEVQASGTRGSITLNRPEKLNPLSTLTLAELAEAAHWLDRQSEIRVVVLSGRGRAFSAGADVASFAGGEPDAPTARQAADAGRLMAEAIGEMRAVTIAAIHGHCVGGGVVLAAACDLRLAAQSTRFSIPEVDLGIPLAWGGIPRLVREIGPAMTKELVLSCRAFTAEEARGLGLINRVLPDDELDRATGQLADELARKSPLTLTATKLAVNAAAEELASTAGAWSDADLLLSAFADPESRRVGREYIERLGR